MQAANTVRKAKIADILAVSFQDTRIAFAPKTDAQLRRSYWLFKVINNNFLVRIGPPLTRLAFFLQLPISALIKKTIFAQFCGGETIGESVQTARELGKFNIGSILDYSIEGLQEDVVFEETMHEILRTIHAASQSPEIPFAVFKISGIGNVTILEKAANPTGLNPTELEAYDAIKGRVDKICRSAYKANIPVMIDAEESWIQPAIDEITIAMMGKYNRSSAVVIMTIQLYRVGKLEHLKRIVALSVEEGFIPGIKLVRGAYMEKERLRAKQVGYPSPIQADKENTDKDYDLAQEFLIKSGREVLLISGTHNESSCLKLCRLLNSEGPSSKNPNSIWFAQLLGMSDNLSFNLAAAGFQVAKYLPYGPLKAVMPYLFRRAQENTAIAGQMSREYSLVRSEIRRRRLPE